MNIWEFVALVIGLGLSVWLSIKSETKTGRDSKYIHIVAFFNAAFVLSIFYLFTMTKSISFAKQSIFVLGMPLRLILFVLNLSYLAVLSQVYLGSLVKRRSKKIEFVLAVIKSILFLGLGVYFFENILISLPMVSYSLILLLRILVRKREDVFRFILPNLMFMIVSFTILEIVFWIHETLEIVLLTSKDMSAINLSRVPLEWFLFSAMLYQNVLQYENVREFFIEVKRRKQEAEERIVTLEDTLDTLDTYTEELAVKPLTMRQQTPLDSESNIEDTSNEYQSVQDRLGDSDRTYTK